MLAYTNARIVPAALTKGPGLARLDREAIGTGPFRLVSYEPERLVVVQRNPTYYDPQRPHLDRVEVVVYPDATAEGSALISGNTDLMMLVLPTEFARLQRGERRQRAAHAVRPVLQRELRLRHRALQRCARAPGAGADGGPRRHGGFRGGRFRHAGPRYRH